MRNIQIFVLALLVLFFGLNSAQSQGDLTTPVLGYMPPDRDQIQENIKTSFEAWNRQGEFEKKADYEDRLKNQSQQVFIRTCTEEIQERIKEACNQSFYNVRYIHIQLQPYNPDSEFFNVICMVIIPGHRTMYWENKIYISITSAKEFKDNWSDVDVEVKVAVNNSDWCFVENELCPVQITLKYENNDYLLASPLLIQTKTENGDEITSKQTKIFYGFDDLEINNPYLKGFVFNYSDIDASTMFSYMQYIRQVPRWKSASHSAVVAKSNQSTKQKPVPNPPIINDPGKSAPHSAVVAKSNQSTKPQPKPEPEYEYGSLFQSEAQNNPTNIGENIQVTRTENTPIGPDHRRQPTNLPGRSIVGSLPLPKYNSHSEGKVVVEITVDQDGKVVKASATVRGTTTTDTKLWRAAEEAAKKARFNVKKDAPIFQTGTITYVFTLN